MLIERLPEDGSFKTAYREGDWTLDRQFAKEQVNALRALRADLRWMLFRDEMPYYPIMSPGDIERQESVEQESHAVHDEIMAQLRGEIID